MELGAALAFRKPVMLWMPVTTMIESKDQTPPEYCHPLVRWFVSEPLPILARKIKEIIEEGEEQDEFYF